MKKRMGRKSKVLVAILLAGVLCTGTVVAQAASSESGKLGTHNVGGESYATMSTGVAMARTLSSSYDVYTKVEAACVYIRIDNEEEYPLAKEAEGYYGSEVVFSAPVDIYRGSVIVAKHYAEYGTQKWESMTVAFFE